MKKSIFFLFVFGLVTAAMGQQPSDKVIRLSDPVEETDGYEVYGSKFEFTGKEVSLQTVISEKEVYQNQEVVTKGKIKQVCRKKGCFFMLSNGDNEARVTFKDYSFFIPTDSGGKNVLLKGKFKIEQLSEKKAEHYAKDAGEDPVETAGARQEYRLVATSVKIFK